MTDLTASAGLVRGLLDFAVCRGADRRALVARTGIDERTLGDPDYGEAFEIHVELMRQSSVSIVGLIMTFATSATNMTGREYHLPML